MGMGLVLPEFCYGQHRGLWWHVLLAMAVWECITNYCGLVRLICMRRCAFGVQIGSVGSDWIFKSLAYFLGRYGYLVGVSEEIQH